MTEDGEEGFGEGAYVVVVGIGCGVGKGVVLHGARGAGLGARALAGSGRTKLGGCRSQDLLGGRRGGGKGVGVGMGWE